MLDPVSQLETTCVGGLLTTDQEMLAAEFV